MYGFYVNDVWYQVEGDGTAVKACIPTLSMMDGRRILTVEGLSEREKELYAYAFAEAGAVQCGFCIPGTRRSSMR